MASARFRSCCRTIGALALVITLAAAGATRAQGAADLPVDRAAIKLEPAPPGRLPWLVFDERSGLPQHTIVDLLVDRRGFVWAATQDGAARYNGRAWETVALPRQMGSNYARVMRAADDGGLWIGSFDGGLAHLKDGAWRIYDTTAGLPSNRIRGLLETTGADGTVLWIATDRGVARLEHGRITAFGEASGLPSLDTEGLAETVAVNGEHALLVGTTHGLARFAGERFEAVPVPRQLIGFRINDIVESPGLHGAPALWVASYGGGMAVREDGRWSLLDAAAGLPSNVEVITPSRAADGSPALWIGTEGGLVRFEHGRFMLYDERNGLPIRIIWKVLETTSPGGLTTLWLGTWGGGVVRLSPNMWSAFDATTGVPAGAVTALLLTRDDSGAEAIWAGTSDGELARFSGDRFEPVALPDSLRHAIIFSLLETRAADGTRTLWVASFGGGIGRLEHGRWTVFDKATLPNERIYHLLETSDDDGSSVIWAGSEDGLGRFAHGRWTYYRKDSGLPSEIVVRLLETRDGAGARTLWAATSRGLARLRDGKWNTIGKAEGLAGENIGTLAVIRAGDGTRWLWAGTYSGGASRIRLDDDAARWESFSTQTSPALPSDSVMSISEDFMGRIYLCTTRGLLRLRAREPTAAKPERFDADLFTTEDGLPSSDCQPSARVVDQDGRVWVGTARGVGRFDPRSEKPDVLPKPLVIDRAQLTDRSRLLHGGEALAYSEHNLTFASALLAYGGESRIRYRFQLSGFDPQPSDWTTTGVKEYTNLGAGAYTFEAWARDARGNLSGPASIAFSVKPAPWFTLWAYAAYALLLALAAWAALRWRLRALAARTRQLETEVAARTADLVAARDAMQRLATEDALTGVANRRKFDSVLDQEWRRAQREGHWLSVVLIDVDFFKRYNDRYGHARGDECLHAVAQAIASQCLRPADLVARYGGEEFALVLAETDPDGVAAVLRAIFAAVDRLAIEHADSTCSDHVTISLGATSLRPAAQHTIHGALKRADELLYLAKEQGRHRALYSDDAGTVRALAA
jgi:diguanylate cyclase (GGDEF)-like protein